MTIQKDGLDESGPDVTVTRNRSVRTLRELERPADLHRR